MAEPVITAIGFVIGLIISTIIIFVITKLFGETEGIGRAFLTAIIGAIIYGLAYFLLGQGWLAAIIGGIVWLFALRGLYKIGWLKALVIAAVIWAATTVVGLLLPTAPGPSIVRLSVAN